MIRRGRDLQADVLDWCASLLPPAVSQGERHSAFHHSNTGGEDIYEAPAGMDQLEEAFGKSKFAKK